MKERGKLQNNICKKAHQGINIEIYDRYQLSEEMKKWKHLVTYYVI